jgi:2-iminobutanoate/2-iminopropanoate deaminase
MRQRIPAIERLETSEAPRAIGPYSQAVVAGSFVFLSGQIGLDTSGSLVLGGISAETHQVFRNLRAVLSAAGSDLSHVVKATVYLADMTEFATMNEIYSDYMGQSAPARSTVQVAALPRGARVEIDVVAIR